MNKQIELPSTKEEIREHYRSIRSSLSDDRKNEASKACFTFFSSSFTEPVQILSFASKISEINLWLLNELLASKGQLILPKVNEDSLEIYKVVDCSSLIKSSFSILEPNPSTCKKANWNEITIVLVPGLCFDKNFARIGYGKGHYDRLLPKIRKANPKVSIWGIGFKELFSNTDLEMESHDAPLDKIFLF